MRTCTPCELLRNAEIVSTPVPTLRAATSGGPMRFVLPPSTSRVRPTTIIRVLFASWPTRAFARNFSNLRIPMTAIRPAPTPTDRPLRLGVLISGGGSTLANFLEKITAGELHAEAHVVIASQP